MNDYWLAHYFKTEKDARRSWEVMLLAWQRAVRLPTCKCIHLQVHWTVPSGVHVDQFTCGLLDDVEQLTAF